MTDTKEDIHLQILSKIAYTYGIERAVSNLSKKTELFQTTDPIVLATYAEGYEEGKKQRLENLLTKG